MEKGFSSLPPLDAIPIPFESRRSVVIVKFNWKVDNFSFSSSQVLSEETSASPTYANTIQASNN